VPGRRFFPFFLRPKEQIPEFVMRPWVRPVLILALLVALPLPAWSIIIETRDGKVYKGTVVSEDTVRYVINISGKGQTTISKAQVVKATRIVKADRLQALKPSSPQVYYDYAKELSAQLDDPEVRDVALRLFLINAYLDPEKGAYKSLLEMTKLARNPEEARTFRAMAFLVDLLGDKSALKTEKAMPINPEAGGEFLHALELLRRGKTRDALKTARKPGVARFFDAIPGLMTYGEFVKMCEANPECASCKEGRLFCQRCQGSKNPACPACKGKGWVTCSKCKGEPRRVPLTQNQLNIILQLEVKHIQNPKANLGVVTTGQGPETSWSRLFNGQQMRPVPVLSLLYVTEFDPRQCVYRDGKWQAPSK
jgi:hypothetical protein